MLALFSLFSYSVFLSGFQDFPTKMTPGCRRNQTSQQSCGLCAKNPGPPHCTFSRDRGSEVLRTEVHSWCWAPLLYPTFYGSREICNDLYCQYGSWSSPWAVIMGKLRRRNQRQGEFSNDLNSNSKPKMKEQATPVSNGSDVSVCLKNRVHIRKYMRKYLFGTVIHHSIAKHSTCIVSFTPQKSLVMSIQTQSMKTSPSLVRRLSW